MTDSELAYRKALKMEREHERKHRKYTAKAVTDARAFHYEMPQTHGEDDEELDRGWDLTDGGEGAESVRTSDERRGGSYYTLRIKVARVVLSRKFPDLIEVFNLVVKNGSNRRESIAILAARHHIEDAAANPRYWKHMKKISLFFHAQ